MKTPPPAPDEDPFILPTPSKETLEKALYQDQALHDIHSPQAQREQLEPTESYSPVPMFIIFVFSAMMFWSGWYVQRYSGNFRPDIFDHQWDPSRVAQKSDKPFDPIAAGKRLFSQNCQQCHQAHGEGIPGVYPPLHDSQWVLGDPQRLGKLVLGGMSGPLVVKGQLYNGNMPAFSHWTDQKVAAVLTYIRQEWGHAAEPISEADITAIRQAMGTRSKPWSPEELTALHPFAE
jgi:mono/diheme cytochrome c family protein